MKKLLILFVLFSIGLKVHGQNFQYTPVSQAKGEFPESWDLISGMAMVDEIDGQSVINIQHGGIIKPLVNGQDNHYLSGDFTLEFDAFFDQASNMTGQRYEIRLWQGAYDYNQNNIKYAPITIARNGLKTTWSTPEYGNASNYLKELETLSPVWRHIKVEYANGGLKIFMDDRLLLQFPRFKIQPTMLSIGGGINESQFKARLGITNVSIKGVPKETFVVMFVDRTTNRVLDINLLDNLEEAKPFFPNTRTYFGTITGDYAVRPYDHSDLPKPSISSTGNYGSQTVRPHEHSDIPKVNFLASPTMSFYSLIPAKDAQFLFDLEQGVNTESVSSSYQPQVSKEIAPIDGDYFDQNEVYITPTATLSVKNSELLLELNNTTTTPNYAPISAPEGQLIAGQFEKPLKLKVTLTDLLAINAKGNKAYYDFGQAVEYEVNGTMKVAIEKIYGNKLIPNVCTDSGSECFAGQSSFSFSTNTLAENRQEIFLTQTGKKESNVMNSLIFEISNQELEDPNSAFRINNWLLDRGDPSFAAAFRKRIILYDSYIEVAIYDLLQDLIKAERGEPLSGFTVPFHDPEIMKAQYGLFKTYDGGPNAVLWVRQVGKTLEGPISLGNTTTNDGQRGAAWIKFEIID